LIRREVNDVLARADALLVQARIERGDTPSALAAWRQHMARAATSVGPAAPSLRSAAVPADVAVLTVAKLQDRVGVWMHTRDAIEFRWAESSFADLTSQLRVLTF